MAKPTDKAPAIDKLIDTISGGNRKSSIRANHCISAPIGCGRPATVFKDALSEREYRISGRCQECQDKFYG